MNSSIPHSALRTPHCVLRTPHSVLRTAFLLILCASASAQGEKPQAAAHPGGAQEGQEAKKSSHKANRLIHEKSLYLLQHAYNPVDWYPWGEEAFEAARSAGKPVFISIGYSTCHWCHVMERESFENEEIAAILNQHFIAIKVDREERPDVDGVYMRALQAMNRGGGGWPLSGFLTPQGKPFFLGTYFPPEDDPRGRTGFKTLLNKVIEHWGKEETRAALTDHAERFSQQLGSYAGPKPAASPWNRSMLDVAFSEISRTYDTVHGGFSYPPRFAPKFPRTSTLDFLLAYHSLSGNERPLEMVTYTLTKMSRGGIYDHVGMGFHRYSTDRRWLIPHFEKMLYDNSLIPQTLVDGYRLTGERQFLEVALECLEYLLTRMHHSEGGFYAAEDADSEGEEGKYYVFSRKEVLELLGEEEGKLFADFYGVTAEGNFEHSGKSVLHVTKSVEEFAKEAKKPVPEIQKSLSTSRQKLLSVRSKRVPPLKDDKVLTDWNGFALSALSLAYQATGKTKYLEAAERGAAFVAGKLSQDGKLIHRFRLGEARHVAYLEDYAFLAGGLLDLYEASLDLHYLREARRLAHVMVDQFWDPENGAFYRSGPEHETLILRSKDFYDGAIPSGNSVATRDLVRLSAYSEDNLLEDRKNLMSRLGAALFENSPESHPQLLLAAAMALSSRIDVVVVGASGRAQELVREVHRRYLPSKTVVRLTPEKFDDATAEVPWLKKLTLEGTGYALARRGEGEFQRFETPEELGKFLEK